MKAALAINLVTTDREANQATIEKMISEAARSGAKMIVFGETAPTGMVNNDDPGHDLPFAETVPGATTEQMAALAWELHVWLLFGLLEKEGGRLYDSAVLLSPAGEISLRYRRIDPRWHGKNADPAVYCQGSEVAIAHTELGTVAVLICGDLWNDEVRLNIREIKPDLLVHLFARSFSDGSSGQKQWDKEEIPEFSKRVKEIGVPTLATSYLSSRDLPREAEAVGGAMVFAADGTLLSNQPLGMCGILYCDIPDR